MSLATASKMQKGQEGAMSVMSVMRWRLRQVGINHAMVPYDMANAFPSMSRDALTSLIFATIVDAVLIELMCLRIVCMLVNVLR